MVTWLSHRARNRHVGAQHCDAVHTAVDREKVVSDRGRDLVHEQAFCRARDVIDGESIVAPGGHCEVGFVGARRREVECSCWP